MNREYHHTVDRVPHVVAYVSRPKVTDWKRLMSPRAGKAFPFVYGSNDKKVFAPTVKEGSVLWVFGATPDDRPPSLVVKLNVIGRPDSPGEDTFDIPESVVRTFRKKFNYIAVGDSSKSRFYGYNNASRALLGLVLRAPEINNSTSFLPVGPSPAFHPPAHISIGAGGCALVTDPHSAPYCGIIYFRDPKMGVQGTDTLWEEALPTRNVRLEAFLCHAAQ